MGFVPRLGHWVLGSPCLAFINQGIHNDGFSQYNMIGVVIVLGGFDRTGTMHFLTDFINMVIYLFSHLAGIPPSPEAKKIKDCMICHNVYLGRKSLQAHQKLEHVQEMKQKWMCNICEQGFCTSTKLNDHMNIHMGIKPHTCHVCGKRFTDQSNLRTHVQTHSSK